MTGCAGVASTAGDINEGAAGVDGADEAVTPSVANKVELPRVAARVTVVPALGDVVIVKLALVVPAAIVTLGGTLAAPGWLLDKATTLPPAGAGLATVTAPVEGLPPATLVGLTVNEERGGGGTGLTFNAADLVAPPADADIVATVGVPTAVVDTWKLALVWPAVVVTPPGTVATVLSVESATATPPAGAARFRLTVPVEEFPPMSAIGFRQTAETASGGEGDPGGFTVSVADRVTPL